MAELFDVINAFSPPLKLAWGVWLAWGIAQVFWYRQERRAAAPVPSRPVRPIAARAQATAAPASRPVSPGRRPEPASPAVVSGGARPTVARDDRPRPPGPEAPATPPGLMATHEPEAPQTDRITEPADVPVFDPTRAIVETFSEPAGELDSFVARLNAADPSGDEPHTWPGAQA